MYRRPGDTIHSSIIVWWLSKDSLPARLSDWFFSFHNFPFPFPFPCTKYCHSQPPQEARCFLTTPQFKNWPPILPSYRCELFTPERLTIFQRIYVALSLQIVICNHVLFLHNEININRASTQALRMRVTLLVEEQGLAVGSRALGTAAREAWAFLPHGSQDVTELSG